MQKRAKINYYSRIFVHIVLIRIKKRLLMAIKDLYIVAIDEPTLTRLAVQYTPPQMAFNRTGRFENVAIVGRNEDLHHYTGGATSLTVAFDFYALPEDKRGAMQAVSFLESLVYSEAERPPSRVKLIWGNLFDAYVWLLTSVSVTLTQFDPNGDYLPRYATCSCTFVRDTDVDQTATAVRQQYR